VAGISYSNQYIYFDKDGMVLQSSDQPLEDIPLFEIKNLTTFTLYSKVQMEDEGLLEQILNLANLFQHYEVSWDKVEFDTNDEAYLYTGDIKVLLGKKDNYDQEISALSSVLEKITKNNRKGEIDMRNYKVKGDIILKKTS
jgi:cell division protein FtsQ